MRPSKFSFSKTGLTITLSATFMQEVYVTEGLVKISKTDSFRKINAVQIQKNFDIIKQQDWKFKHIIYDGDSFLVEYGVASKATIKLFNGDDFSYASQSGSFTPIGSIEEVVGSVVAFRDLITSLMWA